MGALRKRLGSTFEWIVAAAFFLATVSVVSLIVRELRSLAPAPGVEAAAQADVAPSPPSVPARAISVPILLLVDGSEIRTGDSIEQVASRLGRAAETGIEYVDQGPRGTRLTRFYEHAGTRFILVFEPVGQAATVASRVAAIFIQ